jgi:hypothetical protein
LIVVLAAMALSRRIEHQTGWSIKKFVRVGRRYRYRHHQVGKQTLTATEPHYPG